MSNAYAYFVRGPKHAAMCRTSIESVKRADPNSAFFVMTDEEKRQWDIPEAAVREFAPGMPIMLANLEAQCRALALVETGDAITFLDTDILMLEPLPVIEGEVPGIEGAHLSITWRDHVLTDDDGEKVEGIASTMPYNYGVMRAISCLPTIEAFIWMRERIRKMHSGHQKWYGNQLALHELAGPRPTEGARVDERRIPWLLTQMGNPLRIAKLPGERWNWTPSKVGERLHGVHSVLHFKGRARGLMESYAKRLELTWHVETTAKAA
jgi:hypothetical protein